MSDALTVGLQKRVQDTAGYLRRLGTRIYNSRESYYLLAPYAILFTTFTIIPVLMSMGLSFTYYNILEPPKWVGWLNYVNLLLNDEIFIIAVQNTLLFALFSGLVGYLMALLFAWMINELPAKIRSVFVLIFYAPTVTFATFTIFQIIFSGDAQGIFNAKLIEFGIIQQPINWLYDPNYMKYVVIAVLLWMSLGINFLAFIAGLQGVDRSLYEAGYIDGIKNRWQELWYITLPSMKPQLMFGAVMSITTSFTMMFQIVMLVGDPSTDYAAHTIVAHLQDYGYRRFDMGYASAIATLLFLMMVFLNKGVQRLLKKVGT
ncbi:MAG: sugar ABC transporter permease [Spirochaetales bacterium]|nr:sugar ABC transporter permease [Spirochaetales bacterium]